MDRRPRRQDRGDAADAVDLPRPPVRSQPLLARVAPVLERDLPRPAPAPRAGRDAAGPRPASNGQRRHGDLAARSRRLELRRRRAGPAMVDRGARPSWPRRSSSGPSARCGGGSTDGSPSTRSPPTTPASGPSSSGRAPGGTTGPSGCRQGPLRERRLRRASGRSPRVRPVVRWTASWPSCRPGCRLGASGSTSTCRSAPAADGFDTWIDRDDYAWGTAVGAPPDEFFAAGQNWGFPPLRPSAGRTEGHRHLAECLRHHMAHAGMLRLDHVMGLHRLFLVPEGMAATDGVYVRYPADEQFAVVAIESVPGRLRGGGRGPRHRAHRGARRHGPSPGAAQLRGRVLHAGCAGLTTSPVPTTGAWLGRHPRHADLRRASCRRSDLVARRDERSTSTMTRPSRPAPIAGAPARRWPRWSRLAASATLATDRRGPAAARRAPVAARRVGRAGGAGRASTTWSARPNRRTCPGTGRRAPELGAAPPARPRPAGRAIRRSPRCSTDSRRPAWPATGGPV